MAVAFTTTSNIAVVVTATTKLVSVCGTHHTPRLHTKEAMKRALIANPMVSGVGEQPLLPLLTLVKFA